MGEEEEKTQGARQEEAVFPHPAAREVCVWGGKSPSCGSLAGKECLPWLGIHIPPSLSGNPGVTPNLDGGVLCLLTMALKGAETDLRGWKPSSWLCSASSIKCFHNSLYIPGLPQRASPILRPWVLTTSLWARRVHFTDEETETRGAHRASEWRSRKSNLDSLSRHLCS